ncbi:UNVERIFIED_CONTAM: hypothetical protein Scaly_2531200 [Sesamum calycinum]|uniref:Retrotransposon gag domain-containing protein n=1 Tax=Sesamum calycinum TaxID=2727403 RepID=A0AAW2LUE0_9LAMI
MRCDPSSYENHLQALFKVCQTGSLLDYQLDFEKLCPRVVGLSPESISDCFLFGLCSDTHKELAILHPTSILQAIGLARLIDTKLQAQPFVGRLLATLFGPAAPYDASPSAAVVSLSVALFSHSAHIRDHPVSVLVDSGSSHNILHPRVASYLHLSVEPLPCFTIMVGNGASITCKDHCHSVLMAIQGHDFTVPVYLLPIHGADVVLGV